MKFLAVMSFLFGISATIWVFKEGAVWDPSEEGAWWQDGLFALGGFALSFILWRVAENREIDRMIEEDRREREREAHLTASLLRVAEARGDDPLEKRDEDRKDPD